MKERLRRMLGGEEGDEVFASTFHSACVRICLLYTSDVYKRQGLQCSITAIGSVVLQGAVNGLGSDIVAAQTAGGKAAQFLSVPLESIGTAMTTYASQNMGAHDLNLSLIHI